MLSHRFDEYAQFSKTSPAGGGLVDLNAALWMHILDAQEQASVPGDIVEIGVWHGYTAALLGGAIRPNEKLGIVDVFMNKDEFLPQITKFAGAEPASRVEFWRQSSFDLRRAGSRLDPIGQIRFAHIDGEHSYEAIENDFLLVNDKLCNDGVIVLDDMFFDGCPQLTAALFDLLRKHRTDITMFGIGLNKAYLCRPNALGFYRKLLREAPIALDALGLGLRTCMAAWSAEATYYGLTPRAAGSPRWLVMNQLTDDVSLLT